MTVLFAGVEAPSVEVADARTDTLVVARVDPAERQVRLLPVPRDLVVPLDGSPERARINDARATGDPVRLVRTLDDELGIQVDRYVESGFAGAVGIVDALGGLRLSVDHPLTSVSTGLDLRAGCQVLDGDQVLALGRVRRDVSVELPDGRRVRDPSGDLGRQDRGAVIAAALLRAVGDVGPGDLPDLVRSGLDQVRVDSGTTVDDPDRPRPCRRRGRGGHLPAAGARRRRRRGPGAGAGTGCGRGGRRFDSGEAPPPVERPGGAPGSPGLGDATGLALC